MFLISYIRQHTNYKPPKRGYVHLKTISVITCAFTKSLSFRTSALRFMSSSWRNTDDVNVTKSTWLYIFKSFVYDCTAGPSTCDQAFIRRYSLSGVSSPSSRHITLTSSAIDFVSPRFIYSSPSAYLHSRFQLQTSGMPRLSVPVFHRYARG